MAAPSMCAAWSGKAARLQSDFRWPPNNFSV
jgi:hypothetical protein